MSLLIVSVAVVTVAKRPEYPPLVMGCYRGESAGMRYARTTATHTCTKCRQAIKGMAWRLDNGNNRSLRWCPRCVDRLLVGHLLGRVIRADGAHQEAKDALTEAHKTIAHMHVAVDELRASPELKETT